MLERCAPTSRGHQMPVSGIDVSAEGMALPRRSAGCQDHRTGIDTPRPFHLALVTRCTGHRPTGIYEKFQCRTVIEYEYTGLLHLPPKESKVVRSCTGERSLTGAGAEKCSGTARLRTGFVTPFGNESEFAPKPRRVPLQSRCDR